MPKHHPYHGGQVLADVHAHSDVAEGSVITVDREWLPAACWCQGTFVWVPQVEVRASLTRSCGLRSCGGADSDFVGALLGTAWLRPPKDIERTRRGRAYRVRRPRRRMAAAGVAARRDLVEACWRSNLGPAATAGMLGVPVYTVNNDLTYLRSRGRLEAAAS